MEEEYLNLFRINKSDQSLNETTKNIDQWQSLNETPNYNDFKLINETPDTTQYENFHIEKRINGVQQQNNNPYGGNPRRRPQGGGLNGLDGFIDEDDDLREFVKQPQVQPQQQILAPPPVQSVQDADVVSIDMFENMNANALLTLANGKLSRINTQQVTNTTEDRQVRFL